MATEAKGLSEYAWAKAGAVFDAPLYPIGKKITEMAYQNCTVVGSENLDTTLMTDPDTGEQKSLVIYLNHLSFFDQAFAARNLRDSIPYNRRVGHPLTDKFYQWRSIKYFPVASMMRSGVRVNRFEVFPVDTSGTTTRGHLDMIKGSSEILKEKGIILIPPEGTRSPTSSLLEAKDGFGLLLDRADCILPLAISGTENILHPRYKPYRLDKIDFNAPSMLIYGKRLMVEQLKEDLAQYSLDKNTTRQALQNAAMIYLALHLPENYWGVYADSIQQISDYQQFSMENSAEFVPFIINVGVNRALAT